LANTTFTTSKLSLDDIVDIVQSTVDPSVAGYVAAIGSLLLRDTGELWIKVNTANTDWQKIESGTVVGVSANNSSTGILDGGALSINTPTSFDVAAGVGIIVDNHTDTLNPTAQLISWAAQTNINVTNIAVTDRTFIALNAAGAVLQSGVDWTNVDHKNYIVLGNLGHANRASIVAFRNNPDPSFDATARLSDLARAIGPFNVDGNIFSPNGINLNLNKSSGHTYRIGNNFHTDKKDTDTTTDNVENVVSFLYSHLDGSGGHTLVTPATIVIDSDNYDDGTGILATVPGGRYTVQVIKYFSGIQGGPSTRIEYGQKTFSTFVAALDLLPDPEHIDNPAFAAGVTRGYLIIKAGATDLSDTDQALFVEAAKFGSSGGGQFSGSVTDLQKAYDNSLQPEILTDAIRGAITVKEGPAVGGNLYEGLDDTGTLVWSVDVNGNITTNGTVDGVNVSALQVEVDNIETASGLLFKQADGTFDSIEFGPIGTLGVGPFTYISDVLATTPTLLHALKQLDTALTPSTIIGNPTPANDQQLLAFPDATRAGKVLSVETDAYHFSETTISPLEWIQVGVAANALTGIVVPFNGTIVRAVAHCADTAGNAKSIDLYVDAVNTATIGTFPGVATEESFIDNTLNIDVAAGNKIRLRGGAEAGNIQDTVISLYIKWRV